MGLGLGRGERPALRAKHPAQAWPGEVGGTSQRAVRLLIQPELVGRGCIYHPITVTNPGSST